MFQIARRHLVWFTGLTCDELSAKVPRTNQRSKCKIGSTEKIQTSPFYDSAPSARVILFDSFNPTTAEIPNKPHLVPGTLFLLREQHKRAQAGDFHCRLSHTSTKQTACMQPFCNCSWSNRAHQHECRTLL